MRVLLWTHLFSPDIGGVQSVVRDLGACLVQRGYEVHVLTSLLRLQDQQLEQLLGMTVHRLPFIPWNGQGRPDDVPLTGLFVRCINRIKPDLLHVHYLGALTPHVLACLSQLRVPLMATVHGSDIHGLASQQPTHQQAVRDLLGKADVVTAVSEELVSAVRSSVPVVGEGLLCIRNGIRPVYLPDESLRNPFAHLRPYVLAVGRLVPVKRFDLLLAAFAELRTEQGSLYHLVVLGDGPCAPALRERARDLDVADRVIFAGLASHEVVLAVMRDAECLAISSSTEGLPVAALEAMMVGCPVVATRVGGVPELVKQGRTGILVDPGSSSALREGIGAILEQRERRAEIVRAAQEFVMRHCTVERMTQEYEAAYRRCLARTSERLTGC